MDIKAESLKKHYEWNGKIEVVARCPVETREDMSLAYTPGVAEACLVIKDDVNKLFKVSRNCFKPAPNVDSAVISLDKHDRFNINDKMMFDKFIKAAFQYKRKNLRNNLKNYDLNIISEALQNYGYDLTVRAEALDVRVFVDIANALKK